MVTDVLEAVEARRSPLGRLGARLSAPGPRRWYAGAAFGLVYQAIEVGAIWSSGWPLGDLVVATVVLVAFYLLYLLLPPVVWSEPERVRVLTTLGLAALAVLLLVPVGYTAVWTWTLVLVVAAFTWSSQLAAFALVAVAVLGAALVAALHGWPDSIAAAPLINGSVGVLMVAFGQQVRQTIRLRAANDRIAQLAVTEERARFARDLHDSLGHSLTVVAVKAELAGKLVDRDAAAARREIGSVETLAREALADLRASVSGYRGVTLPGELAAAREALGAAGVTLTVIGGPEVVREDLRDVFGWAIREGVTNVLRHARATSCTVELRRSGLRIRDDGTGAGGPDATGGGGLRGIAERAAVAGAHVETRRPAEGGFELRVER